MAKFYINEEISSAKVVLIDADGKSRGEILKYNAILEARSQGLDLVQVSGGDGSNFPTCKIVDYGKMKYEQSKKAKSTPKIVKEKSIFFHINTSAHDIQTKKNHAIELLSKGVRVRFGVDRKMKKRRQLAEAVQSKDFLMQIVSGFADIAKWDDIKTADRFMFTVLVPK